MADASAQATLELVADAVGDVLGVEQGSNLALAMIAAEVAGVEPDDVLVNDES